MSDHLFQFNGAGALRCSGFQEYRARHKGHTDSLIGGTSRETRRDTARRNPQPGHRVKPHRKPALGF